MKKFLIFLLFTLVCSNFAFAEVAFNFDNNDSIDLNDLIYFISWLQADKTTNSTTVLGRAQEIYSPAQGPLVRLPDNSKEDLDGNGVADLKDLILMIAWLQADKTSSFSTVEGRAKEIYSTVDNLYKLPGTPIGDSTFSTTITGIKTD